NFTAVMNSSLISNIPFKCKYLCAHLKELDLYYPLAWPFDRIMYSVFSMVARGVKIVARCQLMNDSRETFYHLRTRWGVQCL
ncbi:Uncharacterized protein FKW44_003849, partial [Caligus rogercresseyi]